MNTDRFDVWSCGGGTQSVAIAALICKGRLPKPFVSVIADTGYEKSTTWDYMEKVLVPALKNVGVTLHRIKREEWANNWGRELFATSGDLLIPAFSDQNNSPSKLTNFCSKAWKQEVVNRWLSSVHGLTKSKTRKWLGFSLDEPRRWTPHYNKPDVWLPLVNGVPMRRHDCKTLVMREMGWPEPPRSNCWMCPNQSDSEWVDLIRSNPSEFDAAVKMEREIRAVDPNAFLHRQCVPLDRVDWNNSQGDFVRACQSGECFV